MIATTETGVYATHAHTIVADNVRAELARRRISGRELARMAGMTHDYWNRRVSGKVPFDVNDLATVAYYLDVPIMELMAGVSAPVANSHYDGRPGHGTGHDGPRGGRDAFGLAA